MRVDRYNAYEIFKKGNRKQSVQHTQIDISSNTLEKFREEW